MTKEERKLAQQELKLSNKELKELLKQSYKDEVMIKICIRYIQVHPRNTKFKRQFIAATVNNNKSTKLYLIGDLSKFILDRIRLFTLKKDFNFKRRYFEFNLRRYASNRKFNNYRICTKRDFPKLKEYLMN